MEKCGHIGCLHWYCRQSMCVKYKTVQVISLGNHIQCVVTTPTQPQHNLSLTQLSWFWHDYCCSPPPHHPGVNIFKNSPRILGEKFFNFWDLGKSSMKFNSVRFVAIWNGEVWSTWRETFLNVKRNSTQLKGIVSHDEGKLNANYQFTHKFVAIHA